MAATRNGMEWLSQLKASQLHQLAVALGSACSGSKGAIADEICRTLAPAPSDNLNISDNGESTGSITRHQLSIVSIDMGIQNLAYAHILAPQPGGRNPKNSHGAGVNKLPMLNAWERLAVFPSENQDDPLRKSAKLGEYTPSRYAYAAYHFITDIVSKCNPTHVLIEQQRFRSGGSSSVAEWTIRVGIFEGMLHAILQTLREERKDKTGLGAVISINPARTARFWLGGSQGLASELGARKITGREGKQAKIDIVGKSFMNAKSCMVETSRGQAKRVETAFMEKWYSTSKVAKELRLHRRAVFESESAASTPKQPKLDDLADCLLQGLAWLRWRSTKELMLRDLNAVDPLSAVRQRLEGLTQTKTSPKV